MDAHMTSSAVMIIKIIVTPPRTNGAREKCVGREARVIYEVRARASCATA